MEILEIVLTILGFGLLVYGYRKNNRNMLFIAALILIFSVGFGDFVHGLISGFKAGMSGH